ncbi:MAG: hypothetical protein OWQ59_02355 [Alicyclobacillaceae bacterium]|nr:hypothetical protein [Alicyclobacillaceae bacterium]
MNGFALGSTLLGTGVEFIEALTIVLAVGAVRGFKSALLGALAAVVLLAVLVGIIGAPLVSVMHILWLQMIIGLFMLLFGIRWLRKAILRYAGLKALHNEAESYQKELERQKAAGKTGGSFDRFAFATTFGGTFLEGLEAIFIVLTFGLSSHSMSSAILGALIATVVVVLLGVAARRPLSTIPENTMKFVVGVMLTAFGSFWLGESFRVTWPQGELSVVYLVATLVLVSLLLVARAKRVVASSQANIDDHSVEVHGR